jgi:hypothetical protein
MVCDAMVCDAMDCGPPNRPMRRLRLDCVGHQVRRTIFTFEHGVCLLFLPPSRNDMVSEIAAAIVPKPVPIVWPPRAAVRSVLDNLAVFLCSGHDLFRFENIVRAWFLVFEQARGFPNSSLVSSRSFLDHIQPAVQNVSSISQIVAISTFFICEY